MPILCNWCGKCYRTRQQVDEGSGRTQQPAAKARCFLVAPELSRLAAQADDTVGLQRASSSHHHDLSDVLTKRDNENVQKFKDVLKVSDPFAMESHLVNIITKAVMLGYIKEGVLMQNDIGQAYFGTLVCSSKNRRGPKKKAHLKSWKFAWQTKKNKTTSGIAPLKDDRALFTRFLVVILSRPDLHMEDTISTFKLAEFPSTPFSSDGSLLHCIAKSKLMNILEGLLPHQ